MNLEPRAQRLIRSTSHWVLGLTVASAGLALFGVSQIPKNPLPNLVWAAVAGWVAFTVGRAGYVLSRPPSPATLKQGVLALRSYFRALVVSGALAVVAGGVPTPMSCELELNGEPEGEGARGDEVLVERKSPTGPLGRELRDILTAGLSEACMDRKSQACADASRRAGAATAPFQSSSAPFSGANLWGLCQRGHFAQLEYDAISVSKDGERVLRERSIASFIRAKNQKWFLLAAEKVSDAPEDCSVLPYYDVEWAKKRISIGWGRGGEGESDAIMLGHVWTQSCMVETVSIWVDDEGSPTVLDPGCWFDDGWDLGALGKEFVLPVPTPDEVTVEVEFIDGTLGGSTLRSPNLEGDPSGAPISPKEEAPLDEPEEKALPESSVDPEPEVVPREGADATTYAEAAAILEPCWRMLTDALPVRTGGQCAEAYDRTLGVLGGDDAGLADVLREAAEVGRAWGDADAELSVKPAPGAAASRKIAKRKREANLREQELLPRRTAALMGFARKALKEVGGDDSCRQKQVLVLHALEALSTEFDESSMASAVDFSGLGAAAEHARTALRRASEACAPHAGEPGDSQFHESAKTMVSDSLKLGAARREHSRCVEGGLAEVCARPGGLEVQLRTVLVEAIRTVARR